MNKMKKSLFLLGISLVIFSLVLMQVSAITGTLKTGSRMVVKIQPGESIRKYITVENKNDVSLTVDISSTGDLYKSVELEDESFVLEAGAEKKVYFTITADKPGMTETKLVVRFTPEEGNGVGLASTIIVITEEKDNYFDTVNKYDNETGNETFENISLEDDSGFSLTPSGKNIEEYDKNLGKGFEFTPAVFLAISSIFLVVVFVFLILYLIKAKKKRSGRTRD